MITGPLKPTDCLSELMLLVFGTERSERLSIVSDNDATH